VANTGKTVDDMLFSAEVVNPLAEVTALVVSPLEVTDPEVTALVVNPLAEVMAAEVIALVVNPIAVVICNPVVGVAGA